MVATTTWLEHSTLKYCGASWVDKQASDRASTKQEFADSFLLMFHKFGVEPCNQAVALTRSFTLICWLQQEPLRQHLAHKVAARKPRPSTSKQYPGCLRTHSTVKLFSDRFGDFLVRSCHAASESSIRRCGPLDVQGKVLLSVQAAVFLVRHKHCRSQYPTPVLYSLCRPSPSKSSSEQTKKVGGSKRLSRKRPLRSPLVQRIAEVPSLCLSKPSSRHGTNGRARPKRGFRHWTCDMYSLPRHVISPPVLSLGLLTFLTKLLANGTEAEGAAPETPWRTSPFPSTL